MVSTPMRWFGLSTLLAAGAIVACSGEASMHTKGAARPAPRPVASAIGVVAPAQPSASVTTIETLPPVPPAICANRILEAPETCDDGNDEPGDGCDASCQLEPGYVCRDSYAGKGPQWCERRTPIAIKSDNAHPRQRFGGSIAISADGSTLVVGAGGDGSEWNPNTSRGTDGPGAIFVYERKGATWRQQAKLVVEDPEHDWRWGGGALALSADGMTLATAGGTPKAVGRGVSVFRRTGPVWRRTGMVYGTPTDQPNFGWSVALSGDGRILTVGDIRDAHDAFGVQATPEGIPTGTEKTGAIYVWRDVDGTGTWKLDAFLKPARRGLPNLAAGDDPNTVLGSSPALSRDGKRIVALASMHAFHVFERTAAGWVVATDRDLPLTTSHTQISADGTHIALVALKKDRKSWLIQLLALDAAGQWTSVHDFPNRRWPFAMALSADGERVYFTIPALEPSVSDLPQDGRAVEYSHRTNRWVHTRTFPQLRPTMWAFGRDIALSDAGRFIVISAESDYWPLPGIDTAPKNVDSKHNHLSWSGAVAIY